MALSREVIDHKPNAITLSEDEQYFVEEFERDVNRFGFIPDPLVGTDEKGFPVALPTDSFSVKRVHDGANSTLITGDPHVIADFIDTAALSTCHKHYRPKIQGISTQIIHIDSPTHLQKPLISKEGIATTIPEENAGKLLQRIQRKANNGDFSSSPVLLTIADIPNVSKRLSSEEKSDLHNLLRSGGKKGVIIISGASPESPGRLTSLAPEDEKAIIDQGYHFVGRSENIPNTHFLRPNQVLGRLKVVEYNPQTKSIDEYGGVEPINAPDPRTIFNAIRNTLASQVKRK